MIANLILGIYVVLLVAGGLVGYLKAHSKISLITSVTFAALLLLAQVFFAARHGVEVLLVLLLVVFGVRYAKGKKFMPAGLLAGLTTATLILRLIL